MNGMWDDDSWPFTMLYRQSRLRDFNVLISILPLEISIRNAQLSGRALLIHRLTLSLVNSVWNDGKRFLTFSRIMLTLLWENSSNKPIEEVCRETGHLSAASCKRRPCRVENRFIEIPIVLIITSIEDHLHPGYGHPMAVRCTAGSSGGGG